MNRFLCNEAIMRIYDVLDFDIDENIEYAYIINGQLYIEYSTEGCEQNSVYLPDLSDEEGKIKLNYIIGNKELLNSTFGSFGRGARPKAVFIDDAIKGELKMNKIIEMGLDAIKNKILKEYEESYLEIVSKNKVYKLARKFEEDVRKLKDGDNEYYPYAMGQTQNFFTKEEQTKLDELQADRDSRLAVWIEQSKIDNELLKLCDTYEERFNVLHKWVNR